MTAGQLLGHDVRLCRLEGLDGVRVGNRHLHKIMNAQVVDLGIHASEVCE